MVYTIIANNGRSYDLPKKTVTVMEDLDQAITIDNNKKDNVSNHYLYIITANISKIF